MKSQHKQTNILVTGANGCIGHVLVGLLSNSRHEVTALALDENDADKIKNIENVRIVFGDICDRAKMEEIFSASIFDIMIHLAGIVHKPDATLEECMEVNCRATSELLEISKRYGVKQFIFVSTVAVYGEGIEDVLGEASMVNPQTPYAVSKYKAEEYIKSNHGNALQYTVIRPTTVYGKYDRGNIDKMVRIARRGFVPIIGDGNNRKSFVYVENLAEGISKTIFNDKAYNETFILSDAEPYSVNLIVKTIEDAINRKVVTLHLPITMVVAALDLVNRAMRLLGKKPLLPNSLINKLVTNNVFNISKASRVLGYIPRYGLGDGLKKTYSSD